jgi:eukaryotic-like serine/threonine-protein kinase
MITLCPSDEELLAVASGEPPSSELESHLRECNRCLRKVNGLRLEVKELQKAFGTTENEAIHSPPIAVRTQSAKPAAPAGEPKKIGKYLVVGTLGGGGQANVYRAVHPTLDEQVVLKLSSRTLADGDSLANDRLISEGRIICQLKHPNIGRVFDLDFFEHRPFLVMEFVRGRSLDQYLRDRKISWGDIIVLTAQIARALDAAHRLGIVHQDVKPQNIVIDENDEPKLIDFGMARLNGTGSDERAQPLGGTINYMAPEQARAEAKNITGRCDIFALGAVTYYLITGKPPFAAPTRDESLSRARDCNFDKYALEQSGVPPRLQQIVLKAMSANPDERFATAGQMAEALEAIHRSAQRRRNLVRSIPLIVVILAAATIWYSWPKPIPVPPDGQIFMTRYGQNTLTLPLKTDDQVEIAGQVPREPSVVFWIASTGEVSRMPVKQVHGAGAFDQLYAPDKDQKETINGPPGTEFVIVVAGKNLSDDQNVDALQKQLQTFFANHALTALTGDGAVVLGPAGAQTKYLPDPNARGFELAGPDEYAGVSSALDNLSHELKNQGYFFAGIAVPHLDKDSGSAQ